jgi:hypothetical protein
MNLGKLLLRLSADTSSFGKSMDDAAQKVERVAQKVKGASNDIAQTALAFTAMAAGAAAVASKYDSGVARSLTRVQDQFNALAVEVGRSLIPAMNTVANVIGGLVTAFRSLSPEVKGQISDWAIAALKIGGTALVVSRLAAVVKPMAEMFGLVGSAIVKAFSFKAFLPAILALGGIVAAIGAVRIAMAELDSTKDTRATVARTDRLVHWQERQIAERDSIKQLEAQPAGFMRDGRLRAHRERLGVADREVTRVREQMRSADTRVTPGGQLGSQFEGLSTTDAFVKSFEMGAEPLVKALTSGPLMDGLSKLTAAFDKALSGKGGAVAGPTALDKRKEKEERKFWLQPERLVGFGQLRDLEFDSGAGLGVGSPAKEHLRQRALRGEQVGQVQRDTSLARFAPTGAGPKLTATITPLFVREAESAAKAMGSAFMDASGAFGRVVRGFMQGGLIGAGASLLMESKQFQQLAGGLGEIVSTLADALGTLLEPFLPLLPIISTLALAVTAVLAPLRGLLTLAIQPLSFVLKVVASVVLAVAYGIGLAWNALMSAIKPIVEFFGGSVADQMVDTAGMEAAMAGLWTETTAAAEGAAQLGAAAEDTAEALTNVASGFKVENARYNAIDVAGGLGGVGGSGSADVRTGLPNTPEGAPGGASSVHVYLDGKEIIQRIRVEEKLESVRRTGRYVPLNPRYATAR